MTEQSTSESQSGRGYAGQTWSAGMIERSPIRSLVIIAHDLYADAGLNGIALDNPIELWKHCDRALKGLFIGDTTPLIHQGWTKLATL